MNVNNPGYCFKTKEKTNGRKAVSPQKRFVPATEKQSKCQKVHISDAQFKEIEKCLAGNDYVLNINSYCDFHHLY